MLPAPDRVVKRLDDLIAVEERAFLERAPRASTLAGRARESLAGGVTSSWQISHPQPIWIERGEGSHVWDVDGNELVDFHGGYGVMLAGHAHPAVVDAVQRRVALGTHFAQPVADAIVVAEELKDRYGFPLWRFGNSGTEATMDAVHLMRAFTGRDLIVKFEGAYHGHHDSVQVSVWNEDDLGPARRPHSVAADSGIPEAIVAMTLVAPFNDADAVAAIFAQHGDQIAGVIVEPILQNCGILLPAPGFLEALRSITSEHGALLTFDEVKTGVTVGRGGATRLFGVHPDIVCLAKAIGGGLPISAIGGSAEVMGLIVDRAYEQVGTFNGNPLSLAAARAMLTEIMVDDAYDHLFSLRQRMEEGARSVIAEYGLEAHVTTAGAKGSVMYAGEPLRTYRDFLAVDARWARAAWLYQFNRGVFLPPWSKGEQWLVSVQHTEDDVDRYLETFDGFAAVADASVLA